MSRRTWFGTHRRFFGERPRCVWLWPSSFRALRLAVVPGGGNFDETAAGRDLFPGTVSAERVRADILGRVEIEGLRWTADDGTLLAEVPARGAGSACGTR